MTDTVTSQDTQAEEDAATIESIVNAVNSLRIRKLTNEELDVFAGAIIRAQIMLPSFRHALALMRPMYDPTAQTAYTDAFARVGVSPWFFEKLDTTQRAGVLLHEAFHNINNTFSRSEALSASPMMSNISSDLEINCNLHKLPKIDVSFMIMPERGEFEDYPLYRTMEQYYHQLNADQELKDKIEGKDKQKGQPDPDCPQHGENAGKSDDTKDDEEKDDSEESQSGSGESSDSDDGEETESENGSGSESGDESQDGEGGSGEGESDSEGSDSGEGGSGEGSGQGECTCSKGQGSGSGQGEPFGCDESSEERSESADAAGVERASNSEKSIARKNTIALVEERLKQSRAAGNSSEEQFLAMVINSLKPAKVNWRSLFRRLVARTEQAVSNGRSDYSFRRPSRRLSGYGKFVFPGMVQYQPKIMLGIDTSGSMTKNDYLTTASEVEAILKNVSKSTNGLDMFSVDTTVKNTKIVNRVKDLNLQGGGGTAMEVAWQYVQTLGRNNMPDVFILSTDGGTNWDAVEIEVRKTKKMFRSIILVTTEYGFNSVPESLLKLTNVLDISEKDD